MKPAARKAPRPKPPLQEGAFDATAYIREINAADSLRIVVSGHLYIEQALSSLVRTRLPHPDAVELGDLRFFQLLDLAIALDMVHPAERRAYIQVNTLRNKLAHEVGTVVTNGDVDDLIKTMNPFQRQAVEQVLGRRLLPDRDVQPILVTLFTNLQVRLDFLSARKVTPLPWLANYEKDLAEAASKADKTGPKP